MDREKKDIVVYQNDLVDRFIFEYKQKEIDLFLAIIMQSQQNSRMVEFSKNDLKNLIKTSIITNDEFTKLVRGLASKNIRYKAEKEWIDKDTGEVIAEKGDFITMNFFDVLIETKDQEYLKVVIKKEFHEYIYEIKKELGFASHSLQNILSLDSRYEKILYLLLNRWKNYTKPVRFEFEYFKTYLAVPKSYKNNDIKRMLEKCKANIQEKIGLKYEFAFLKKGAKVKYIEFIISDPISEIIKKYFDPETVKLEKEMYGLLFRQKGINPELYREEEEK